MADKMIRMAGRGIDGKAKAAKADLDGSLGVRKFVVKKPIIDDSVIIKANSITRVIDNFEPYSSFVVGGKFEEGQDIEYVRMWIIYETAETGYESVGVDYSIEKVLRVENDRFATNIEVAETNRCRIYMIPIGEEDLTLTHLDMYSVDGTTEQNKSKRETEKYIYRAAGQTVRANDSIEFQVDVTNSFTLGLRFSEYADVLISYSDVIAGSASGFIEVGKYSTSSNRLVTDIITPKSNEVRIKIENLRDSDKKITHAFVYDKTNAVSGRTGMSVNDLNGNEIHLTAEKDGDGKGVLRIVDASPFAYDEQFDAKRTFDVSDDIRNPHKTFELVWDDESLEGVNKLSIDLNGRKEILRGTKATIIYKNIEDGHSIYFETRIGGSGSFLKEYIVENGEGASKSENNTIRKNIPDELFPFINFKGASFSSHNRLVFEAPSGDLSNLRAYLVVM